MDYKLLGENIKKYRKRAGLTQEKLAEEVNCSNSHIGQIESGRGVPSLNTVLLIANALGVTVDQLVLSDLQRPELVYLKEISDKIQSYPLKTRILACEMIQGLLKIIDESQF